MCFWWYRSDPLPMPNSAGQKYQSSLNKSKQDNLIYDKHNNKIRKQLQWLSYFRLVHAWEYSCQYCFIQVVDITVFRPKYLHLEIYKLNHFMSLLKINLSFSLVRIKLNRLHQLSYLNWIFLQLKFKPHQISKLIISKFISSHKF